MTTIRSLDWRFLLPFPPAGRFGRVALTGADAAAGRLAVETGVADDVVQRLDADASADAVVCTQGARYDLERAVATVAPGGALYLELQRGLRPRSHPSDVAGRLTRMGLNVVGVYWAHPGFDEAEVYLPLEAPAAIRWYFRNVFTVLTPRARAMARPTAWLTRVAGGRLADCVPRACVVAVKAGTASAPGVLAAPGLTRLLGDDPLTPVVLMNGGWWSKVVVAAFGRTDAEPRAIVKLSRLGHRKAVVAEQDGQRRVREQLPPGLRETVPEPLGIVEWAGQAASVEACARGEWVKARRHRYRRLSEHVRELELVTAWLTAFNAATHAEHRAWTEADSARWVETPIAEFRDCFAPSHDEEALFEELSRRARRLAGVPLPLVWCHHDFSELNLYCSSDSINVVDWEALAPGLPGADLVYYLTRWLYHARRVPDEERCEYFARLFAEPSPEDRAVRAARRALASYFGAIGLDRRLAPLLVASEWIRRATGRHRRKFPAGTDPVAARDSNRYARRVSILAERRDAFFACAEQGWST